MTSVPFDCFRLNEQILKGGGKVYKHVLNLPSCEYSKTVLITDNIVETPDYLLAVSLGIPIYRHDLIVECCKNVSKIILILSLKLYK